jgi:hypothetical protein
VLQLGHEQCPWPSSQQYFASALGLARLQLGGTKAASELLAEMDEQQPTDSPQYKVEAAAGPRLVRLHLLGVCKRVKGSEARVRTTPRDAAAHRL